MKKRAVPWDGRARRRSRERAAYGGKRKVEGRRCKVKKKKDKKVENKKERSRRRAEEDGERCGAE